MNPQPTRFFILLVHYGDPTVTERALTSITHGTVLPTRIIIIDNGTPAGRFMTSQPRCHVVQAQHNGGYAAGLNIGLGILRSEGVKPADIIICMNNDIEVYPETLAALDRWRQEHRTVALVGGVTEDSGQRVYGGKLDLWNGRAILVTDASAVDYIQGSFFAAPYEVFLTLKELPERYFLYWEDVHFSDQAKRAGIPLITLSTVRVRHRDSLATPPSAEQLYYLVRNGAHFLEKETPRPWRAWWWFLNRGRMLYHQRRRGVKHQLVAQALADARRTRMGQRRPPAGAT